MALRESSSSRSIDIYAEAATAKRLEIKAMEEGIFGERYSLVD